MKSIFQESYIPRKEVAVQVCSMVLIEAAARRKFIAMDTSIHDPGRQEVNPQALGLVGLYISEHVDNHWYNVML